MVGRVSPSAPPVGYRPPRRDEHIAPYLSPEHAPVFANDRDIFAPSRLCCLILPAHRSRNRRSSKRLKSNGDDLSCSSVAAISPIAAENLKPWPEHGLAIRTWSCTG